MGPNAERETRQCSPSVASRRDIQAATWRAISDSSDCNASAIRKVSSRHMSCGRLSWASERGLAPRVTISREGLTLRTSNQRLRLIRPGNPPPYKMCDCHSGSMGERGPNGCQVIGSSRGGATHASPSPHSGRPNSPASRKDHTRDLCLTSVDTKGVSSNGRSHDLDVPAPLEQLAAICEQDGTVRPLRYK